MNEFQCFHKTLAFISCRTLSIWSPLTIVMLIEIMLPQLVTFSSSPRDFANPSRLPNLLECRCDKKSLSVMDTQTPHQDNARWSIFRYIPSRKYQCAPLNQRSKYSDSSQRKTTKTNDQFDGRTLKPRYWKSRLDGLMARNESSSEDSDSTFKSSNLGKTNVDGTAERSDLITNELRSRARWIRDELHPR